jgi:hypothetical protein
LISQTLYSSVVAQTIGKVTSFIAKLDSSKYPDYRPIFLRPLWCKQIEGPHDIENIVEIFHDTLLFTGKKHFFDMKTGNDFRLDDIKLKSAKRILITDDDSIFVLNLLTKKINQISGKSYHLGSHPEPRTIQF